MAASLDNLTISSSIENNYAYSVGSGPTVTIDPAPNNVHLRVGANDGGNLSEVGLDLTSHLDGDSFSFLHNGYCIGTCTVSIYTTLNFTLTNDGDDALDVRWDSLITPGHLAQLGSNGSALFHFIVIQGNDVGGGTAQHSEARGETYGWYDDFALDATGLAGLKRETYSETVGHLNAWSFADWSATSLNLDLLAIPGHSTSHLSYFSWVEMAYDADCTDLSNCGGVQVAFGDPRDNGGVRNRLPLSDPFPASPLAQDILGIEPLIGRQFDAYVAPSAFVEQGEPLPGPPPLLPPVNYGPRFGGPVPEPASWLLLLLGFGGAGGALRRRPGVRAGRLTPQS